MSWFSDWNDEAAKRKKRIAELQKKIDSKQTGLGSDILSRIAQGSAVVEPLLGPLDTVGSFTNAARHNLILRGLENMEKDVASGDSAVTAGLKGISRFNGPRLAYDILASNTWDKPEGGVNPVSEAVKATQGRQRVGGVESMKAMAERYPGLSKEQRDFLGSEAFTLIAGTAADILGDPTTYGSLGTTAATKAQAATKIEDIVSGGVDAAKLTGVGLDVAELAAKHGDDYAKLTKGGDLLSDLASGIPLQNIPPAMTRDIEKAASAWAGLAQEGTKRVVNAPFLRKASETGEVVPYSWSPTLRKLGEGEESKTILGRLGRKMDVAEYGNKAKALVEEGQNLERVPLLDLGTKTADRGGIKLLGETVLDVQPYFDKAKDAIRAVTVEDKGAVGELTRKLSGFVNNYADIDQQGNRLMSVYLRRQGLNALSMAKRSGAEQGLEAGIAIDVATDPRERVLMQATVEEVISPDDWKKLDELYKQRDFNVRTRDSLVKKHGLYDEEATAKALASADVAGRNRLEKTIGLVGSKESMIGAIDEKIGSIVGQASWDRARDVLVGYGVEPQRADELTAIMQDVTAKLEQNNAARRALNIQEAELLTGTSMGYTPHYKAAPDTWLDALREKVGMPTEYQKAREEVSQALSGRTWGELGEPAGGYRLGTAGGVKPDFGKQRTMGTTLRDRFGMTDTPAQVEMDFGRATAMKVKKDVTDIAKAEFENKLIADMGLKPADATLDEIGQKAVKTQMKAQGLVPWTVKRTTGDETYYVPEVLTDYFDKMTKTIAQDESTNALMRGVDRLNAGWKKLNTVVNPRFHLRNAPSNYTLAWMKDADLADIGSWNDAIKARIAYLGGSGDSVKVKVGGEWMTANDLMDVTKGTVMRGQAGIAGDVGQSITREVKANAPREGVLDELGREINPFNAGQKAGSEIEDTSRLGVYLAARKKGLDHASAVDIVDKTLYNYLPENLTVFERDIVKRWIMPFYCVPEDSRILTRDGFKYHDGLQVGEEVLTYNVERDELEWQECESVHVFDHDEELVHWSNRHHSLRYTPEHRWVTYGAKTFVKGKWYGGRERRKLLPAAEIRKTNSLVVAAEYNGTSSLLSPEDARLYGWLLGDGTWRWRGNCCEAAIYQHPSKPHHDEVCAIAGGRLYTHPTTGVTAAAVLKERIEPLKDILRDRANAPAVAARLSREAAEAMYEALMRAEGHTSRKGTNRACTSFSQSEGPVLDAFLILATMLGKRVTVRKRKQYPGGFQSNRDQYTVYISKRQSLSLGAGKMRTEHYTGKVWCPKTPNQTWVMLQDGLITITGNTWARQNIPNMLEIAVKQPGKVNWLTKLRSNAYSATGTDPSLVPDYLKDQGAIPLPMRSESGGRLFVNPSAVPSGDVNKLTGDVGSVLAGMGPWKLPFEMVSGNDWYYKEPISAYTGDKSRAPGVFQLIDQAQGGKPAWEAVKKALGMAYNTNQTTGEKYVAMDPYVLKATKDLGGFWYALMQLPDPRPQGKYTRASFFTGIKLTDMDEELQAKYRDEDIIKRLEDEVRRMRDEGIISDKKAYSF